MWLMFNPKIAADLLYSNSIVDGGLLVTRNVSKVPSQNTEMHLHS